MAHAKGGDLARMRARSSAGIMHAKTRALSPSKWRNPFCHGWLALTYNSLYTWHRQRAAPAWHRTMVPCASLRRQLADADRASDGWKATSPGPCPAPCSLAAGPGRAGPGRNAGSLGPWPPAGARHAGAAAAASAHRRPSRCGALACMDAKKDAGYVGDPTGAASAPGACAACRSARLGTRSAASDG